MIKLTFVALTLLATIACTASAPTPSSPNFVVVSTDWRQALVSPNTTSAGNPTGHYAIYSYTAHGIFRNQGGQGSAVVTFEDQSEQCCGIETKCTTTVQAGAGQVVEASCAMGEIDSPYLQERRTAQPPVATLGH